MDWVGRNGAAIPLNMTVDNSDCSVGCVVTSGTFANSQFFLEYRPYIEDTKFWNVNPGMEWKINDSLKFDMQLNKSNSTFHRQSPTVLVSTVLGSGLTVNFNNNGGGIPSMSTSGVDLDDPANFGWGGSRVNIQDEKRTTDTKGVRGNLTWGSDAFNLKVGAAYDDISRNIQAFDNSQAWQNAVCGDNPNMYLPGPNSQPPCQGLSTSTPGAGYPTYPGLGTGYSATGYPASLTYSGSLVPSGALASYLQPGPAGFVTVNWPAFRAASGYDAFHETEGQVGSSNTGASGGFVEEKDTGFYAELNGDTAVMSNRLKYTVGIRWVQTKQTIEGLVSVPNPLNTATPAPADGALYPNITNFNVATQNTYSNALPSLELTYFVSDNAAFKFATSKTMTRANPNSMLPGLSFSDPSAANGSVGNPALMPFTSQNLDFGFEFFTGHEGYFDIMSFRKHMVGFTVNGNTTLPFASLAAYGVTYATLSPTQQAAIDSRGGANTAMVTLTEQVNAPGPLVVNGVEFNWVQPLDFLLGKIGLNGFGFNANYTIVDQYGSGAAPAIAVGVPPHTFNLTFYYQNHGVDIRMSQVYYAANPASTPGQNGITTASIYNDTYRQWDFASSFDLAKLGHWSNAPEITFDVNNLFDAKLRSYFQFSDATYTEYAPGRFYTLGIRQKF